MNNILSELFREIIIKMDLIDTGALYRSIVVTVTTQLDSIIVDIEAEDYLKFLWERYGLIEQFTNDAIFQREMEKIYERKYLNQVQNLLSGVKIYNDTQYNDIVITINGERPWY